MGAADRSGEVVAAGALVVRKQGGVRSVLLVHRPKYDDWSFPKGKQEPGEHVTATAVREVLEETAVPIRLGRPLPPQQYADPRGRTKTVHYWVGHLVGPPEDRTPDDEVDRLSWEPISSARPTYADDQALLAGLDPRITTPLVVLRHAKAGQRSGWDQPDPLRPLSSAGQAQAEALVPVLAAYGIERVVTSSSVRCAQKVAPFVQSRNLAVLHDPALSEERYDERRVGSLLEELLASRTPAVVCTHRPQLPRVLALLGIDEEPLAKGELVVCHHRKGRVVATERHLP